MSDKVKKIILVRHGRTDWNDEFRFQGITDIPLNDAGIIQARKTASRLSGWPVDAVYSSPLQRALKTAEALCAPHGLEPLAVKDLEEINFGDWEGHSINSLKNRPEFFEWLKDPFFNMPPGAETWEMLKKRVNKAVNAILNDGHRHIAIVSHGGIMRVLYVLLLNLSPHSVWNLKAYNCSISGIEMGKYENSLAFLNDCMHLNDIPENVRLPVW